MNLTVVIPTRNRSEQLKRLVNELRPLHCEIIVVDDSDQPVAVDGVKIVRNAQKLSLGVSRNLGCSLAKSDWVLFLDDDVLPSPDLAGFIEGILPRLKTTDVIGFRIVGFNTMGSKTVRAETSDTTVSRILNILFGVDVALRTGPARFIPAPAVMYNSKFYASLGGCDSSTYRGNAFRLSSDLQWRARKMGGRLFYFEEPSFEHLNIAGGHAKGHSENDVYWMRNQTIFAIRTGGAASLVMIIAYGVYMLAKGFMVSALIKGVAQGLSVTLTKISR